MADTYTLADLMRERYGEGYTAPQMQPADGEIYDTRNVTARLPQDDGLSGSLRSIAARIRDDSRPDNVLAGGVDTAANWLEGRQEVGRDTAAPLGAGMLASFLARPRPRFTPPPAEWPTEAAIRIGDQIFTGPHHLGALERAQATLGGGTMDIMGRVTAGGDGFVTNTGRYVTRAEAARLVNGDYAPGIRYMSEAMGVEREPIRTNYGWASTSATGSAIPGALAGQSPREPDEFWWRQRP